MLQAGRVGTYLSSRSQVLPSELCSLVTITEMADLPSLSVEVASASFFSNHPTVERGNQFRSFCICALLISLVCLLSTSMCPWQS